MAALPTLRLGKIAGWLAGVSVVILYPQILQGAIEVITESSRARYDRQTPPPELLLQGVAAGTLGEGDLATALRRRGYSAQWAGPLAAATEQVPTPTQLIELFWRGKIDWGTVVGKLRKAGYWADDVALIEQALRHFPSVHDLIRMAVREVFTPEIAEKFGQYQDIPKEFLELAHKAGLDEEQAKWYWAAHWELPSATMGFEMFHRGIITYDELKMLLRALDVMPYWRDKLIELSYNLPTRVDVRRMYRLGILSREQVLDFYRKLGYAPEVAEALTEFTVRYETPETEDEHSRMRELTQATIIKAYKKGVIDREAARNYLRDLRYDDKDIELLLNVADFDKAAEESKSKKEDFRELTTAIIQNAYSKRMITREEAISKLMSIDYSEEDANFILDYVDYVREDKIKTKQLDFIHDLYVQRTINIVDCYALLNELGIEPEEAKNYILEWDLEREMRAKKLPESTLAILLRRGIIDIETYKEELRGLGYSEKYVEWLAQLRGAM